MTSTVPPARINPLVIVSPGVVVRVSPEETMIGLRRVPLPLNEAPGATVTVPEPVILGTSRSPCCTTTEPMLANGTLIVTPIGADAMKVPALVNATAESSPASIEPLLAPRVAKVAPARLLIAAPASSWTKAAGPRSHVAAPWLFRIVPWMYTGPSFRASPPYASTVPVTLRLEIQPNVNIPSAAKLSVPVRVA